MENNPALLKSSVFGGFKKKDVLSYIFELNEATQDEKQKLAEQIEELAHSRESLSESVSEMERQITELKASLNDVTGRFQEEIEKNARYAELVEELKSQASKHESIVSHQNAEIARQTELNAKLSEKNRAYEEKRNQVELAASQIAGLLGQAQNDAASVVSRAKLEAEDIIKNAKASIEAHVDEANKSVDDAYKKFYGFKAELDTLHVTITGAASAMTEKMQSLQDTVSDIGKLVPEKLSAETLPTLQYEKDDDPKTAEAKDSDSAAFTAAAISPSVEAEAANMTTDILRRYGVRKDDSGFFRLASDK